MITAAQLTRQADRDGVDAKVVERDYVLAHLVAQISAHDPRGQLVFKGGTSLRLLHFAEFRYSADLDYSLVSGTQDAGHALVAAALASPLEASITDLGVTDASPPRIRYRGPLGRPREVKIDLAADELVIDTERRAMIERWDDVPETKVLAYTLLEVTAEKLRCVLQRRQCRDLFDLDVLFQSGIVPSDAARSFARKAIHRGLDPAEFSTTFARRSKEYGQHWSRKLVEHLGVDQVPHFDEVLRRVRRSLRTAGLDQAPGRPPRR